MNIKPVQIEIDNVCGQASGSDRPAPEPSHIHIPRPSRVRLEADGEQALLEPAA